MQRSAYPTLPLAPFSSQGSGLYKKPVEVPEDLFNKNSPHLARAQAVYGIPVYLHCIYRARHVSVSSLRTVNWLLPICS